MVAKSTKDAGEQFETLHVVYVHDEARKRYRTKMLTEFCQFGKTTPSYHPKLSIITVPDGENRASDEIRPGKRRQAKKRGR